MNLNIKRFDKGIALPENEVRAACFDLRFREATLIRAKEVKLVPANVAVEIPDGYAILLFVRSSTPLRKGLMLANGVGVVDPFFCGDRDEIMVQLFNFSDGDVSLKKGERLVQGMLIKSEPVTWNEVDAMKEKGVGGYNISSEKHSMLGKESE